MFEQVIRLHNGVGIYSKYTVDDKPAILFLHFSGGNLRMWDGVIPHFENNYRIIAPDFRGHGKSDKPMTGYHIDDMANDIYLLLRELNVAQCHVVGSSLGAEVGISLAASHPEMVLSVVCEGAIYNEFGEFGLYNGDQEEMERREEYRAYLADRVDKVYESKSAFIEEEKAKLEEQGLWNEFFLTFLEGSVRENEEGNFITCYPNYVRKEYIEKYLDIRFEDYYKKIKCPVLFLPSEEEWKNEKIQRSLQTFSSFLEVCDIKKIDGSVHAYVWMQYPAHSSTVVDRFLSNMRNLSL